MELSKLDLIRTIAVLLVVVSHLPISQKISNYLFGFKTINIQPMGLVGVGIFFVHTSLVLMMSLKRQTLETGTNNRATVFLIRRSFRIYPLSVATVLILTLIKIISNANINYFQIVANLLLVQNITGHASIPYALWSLPYEVQMYILLPGIYYFLSRYKNIEVALSFGLWLACIALVLMLYAFHLNYHIVKYFPAFIPGVISYCLLSRASGKRKLPSFVPSLYIITAAFALPFLVSRGYRENILIWPTCLFLGVLIPFCSEILGRRTRKISASIAKYSYGIYLVHGPLIILAFGVLDSLQPAFQWIIFLSATCLISYIAFHAIEKPGIRLGKHFARSFNVRLTERSAM